MGAVARAALRVTVPVEILMQTELLHAAARRRLCLHRGRDRGSAAQRQAIPSAERVGVRFVAALATKVTRVCRNRAPSSAFAEGFHVRSTCE